MLSLFRKDPRRPLVEALHDRIADASRAPGLYERLGVPDTLEGRFESLSLHVILVLRRLRALPAPADDVAQDLVDCVFRHLDANLRELGIGDTVVPKRMKKLAGAFYAVTNRYDALIDPARKPELARALAEGFGIGIEPATGLADYVLGAERNLAGVELAAMWESGLPWPRPELGMEGSR